MLGTSWQSSYGTWEDQTLKSCDKDQTLKHISSLDLHRMLYRDIMAMFLGIHLTVLVIAIPKNSQFDALILERVYIGIWRVYIGIEKRRRRLNHTRDTLSRGGLCISSCTGFRIWLCSAFYCNTLITNLEKHPLCMSWYHCGVISSQRYFQFDLR